MRNQNFIIRHVSNITHPNHVFYSFWYIVSLLKTILPSITLVDKHFRVTMKNFSDIWICERILNFVYEYNEKRASHSNVRHYLDMANALIDELLLPIETDVNIIVWILPNTHNLTTWHYSQFINAIS